MALHSNVTTTKEAIAYSAAGVRNNPPLIIPNNTVLKISTTGTATPSGMYHIIIGGTYNNKYIESFDFRKETYVDE
jgi:hypothetical protein